MASFRFQKKVGLLTYRGHLVKDVLKAFLEDRMKKWEPEIWVAHETSDAEYEYDHTHVVFKLGCTPNIRGADFWDYMGIHPNASNKYNEAKGTAANFQRALAYISKQDVEMAEFKDDGPPKVAKMSIGQICEMTEDQIMGLDFKQALQIFSIRDRFVKRKWESPVRDWYLWQRQLLAMLGREGYPECWEKVVWVHDPQGQTGKTELVKHCHSLPNVGIAQGTGGRNADLAEIVSLNLRSKPELNGFVFNLTRSYEDRDFYGNIECILDGLITRTKFHGGIEIFDRCTVVVMANWLPNWSKITSSRWVLCEIVRGAITLSPPLKMDIPEAPKG